MARIRARILILSTALAIATLASACGSSSGSSEPLATAARDNTATLSLLLMARDIEVADQRLPIVVFLSDEDTTRLDDRLNDLSFAYRHADDESFRPMPDVTWRSWPVRGGAYTARPDFNRPGTWEFKQHSTRAAKNVSAAPS